MIKTLYISPYMVATAEEYTKHYYIEGERVCSKIGGGFGVAPIDPFGPTVTSLNGGTDGELADATYHLVENSVECTGFNPSYIGLDNEFKSLQNDASDEGNDLYFYHSDHLGSSAFIIDASGNAYQHLQYLPFDESYIDQRHGNPSRYTFSGKEKDEETSYSYFGARYYDSDLSVWLSVDPLAGKYPDQSPYSYCGDRPVSVVDINGEYEWEVIRHSNGRIEVQRIGDIGGSNVQILNYSYINKQGEHIQLSTPHAFSGTPGEMVSMMRDSKAWRESGVLQLQSTGYDPSAAYALVDMAEKVTFWTAVAAIEIPYIAEAIGVYQLGKGVEGKIKIPDKVKANFDRFFDKIPSNSKSNARWEKLNDGNYYFEATSEGKVPGSKAVYQKWVNPKGETFKMQKTTIDPDGNIIHVKSKL